jgi:membrane dipeptidase
LDATAARPVPPRGKTRFRRGKTRHARFGTVDNTSSGTSGKAGYRSYSYLEPGDDYEVFDLADELGRVPEHPPALSADQAERTAALLASSMVISLHDHPVVLPRDITQVRDYIRTSRQHTGFAGLAASGLTAVFDNMMDGTGCVTSKSAWKWDETVGDIGMRLCDLAHQDYVIVGRTLADLAEAKRAGRVAIVLGLEAATPIENELDRLDILYGLGIRQIGIAYSESNGLGGGLKEPGDGGLTTFGRKAVRRMNQLGLAIDVSHSGDRTCLDTFEVSDKPVFITHAGARSVWPTPRMKPDDVLRACAAGGGVIGIEAAPHTTLSAAHPEHSIDSVMDHFEYCAELLGIEHVAFGPDTFYGDHVGFHGVFAQQLGMGAWSAPPHPKVGYVAGMENPTENFRNIVGWLVAHGYPDADITAVIGGNILRVLREVW